MDSLIHLIYASSAVRQMAPEELVDLLHKSRLANAEQGVTGMLLHENGHFLQVLEGPESAVVKIFSKIAADPRHHRAVKIIQEPIAHRSFSDWTMAFADVGRDELARIDGLNDFFGDRVMFGQLTSSRAKKLVAAFGNGHWRQKLAASNPGEKGDPRKAAVQAHTAPAAPAPTPPHITGALVDFSYAFQPIVRAGRAEVVSYEALVRGAQGEPAWHVLNRIPPDRMHDFDTESRLSAIELAARLGIGCDLNLNFLPRGLLTSAEPMERTLAAAAAAGIDLSRLVIEVTEGEVIDNHARFAQLINVYRGRGVKVAIDDFGAGYSGLNLLAEFQPDQIKIDMALVRGIEAHGPRQAIVRAIVAVCRDLAIDVIAEGVETLAEYRWLAGEGLDLFQGYLFGKPEFERLPMVRFPTPA